MKQRIGLLVLAVLMFGIACNKENRHPYSDWTVNGRAFRSNNIEKYGGNPKASTPSPSLSCRDFENRFALSLDDGFDVRGEIPLVFDSIQQDGTTGISFYVDTSYYILSQHMVSKLIATDRWKGLASYYLPPTWFHYFYNPSDSVLISGTFNEPE
jgi:hypothetical protein